MVWLLKKIYICVGKQIPSMLSRTTIGFSNLPGPRDEISCLGYKVTFIAPSLYGQACVSILTSSYMKWRKQFQSLESAPLLLKNSAFLLFFTRNGFFFRFFNILNFSEITTNPKKCPYNNLRYMIIMMQALMIHIVSYMNKMNIILSVDESIIPDPHQLCDDFQHSLRLIKEAAIA